MSYLLTHSHHLWRLEASGKRSVALLPAWFTSEELEGQWGIHGCSTAENTLWFVPLLRRGAPLDRLLRGHWDPDSREFRFESVELPPETMTAMNCTPGAVTLYTEVSPPAEANRQYRQAWDEAQKREKETGKWTDPPEIEFSLEARFATLDGPEGWRALPPLITTAHASDVWGFQVLSAPRLTVRWSTRVAHCFNLQGESWVEAPCPPEAPYEHFVSRLDEAESKQSAAARASLPAHKRSMRGGRPTYLIELGAKRFSVGSTSTPYCEPVLRDDVELFVPEPPESVAPPERRPAWWLLVTVGLVLLAGAGGGGWLIRRRLRRAR